MSLVRNTRGYIERVAVQVNNSYESGSYDACAVMLRRLLETLIIECFEKHSISSKIKDGNGNFKYLRDLIADMLSEDASVTGAWNLSRNTKSALPKLKETGDLSAHNRRYLAQRTDLDKLIGDLRLVVQECISIADLKLKPNA